MQNPFGTTRTSVQRDHALIAPDSHVIAPMPGTTASDGARAIVLVSPQVGNARHLMSIVLLDPGSPLPPPATPSRQRFVYVLEGAVSVAGKTLFGTGGFIYQPPTEHPEALFIVASSDHGTTRLLIFEKEYCALKGGIAPQAVIGQEQQMVSSPFMGNEDARLQVLLPDEPAYDMAVNIFTYQPGATLPFVETHVMEHGLLMIAGAGVYRLGESWYPVQEGDAIWMASYCPQWFVAMGKTPARYLYYKDVNRDPLEMAR